jgi:hypothetical protein
VTESTPAKQLASFIDKFDPKVATLIRGARLAMRKRLPTARELVYDNYNFFVIGYAPTERASEAVFSLAAGASGVSLCFIRGATLPDPEHVLLGTGKQTRFVRLPSAATLAEPGVEALMRAAIAQSPVAFPASGKGETIIKSISAKQRPRRAKG